MTAPIVVALTWRAMFNNDAGWINYFLCSFHLPQPSGWATRSGDAGGDHLGHVDGHSVQAVLLLAGLLGVSQDSRRRPRSDGASSWQVFRHVTLPAIRPVLFIASSSSSSMAFRKFEGIQILTTGGPGYAARPSICTSTPPA